MRWPWSRRRTFDSPPKPIDLLLAEMRRTTGTAVTRAEALSVPAVRRGRNEICSVATMPLEQIGPDNQPVTSPLLRQIDPDVANVVTIAQTVEDLLFDGIAWWLVTATDFSGFPVSARHVDPANVTLQPPVAAQSPSPLPSGSDPRGAVVWVDGEPVSGSRIVRFDSPNPALLQHAGREIRRAILLDKAAGMYADDPRPLDYFTPAEGADEIDDDDAQQVLNVWKAARKSRSTAFVPASMRYNTVDAPSPQQLQLAELSRQASLDIANSLGVDPEDLGISTTSRTYSNDVDRRRNKLNEVLSPYMRAITDRLSMGDVTRRGYAVRFNTAEYLLPNPGERWQIYATAKGLGAITVDEIRSAEGMPPMPAPQPAPGDAEDADAATDAPGAVAASRAVAHTFDASTTFTLDMPVVELSVDRENRIIEGLALPYGQYGTKGGITFRFDRGSMRWDADHPGRVKLVFPRHGTAIGRAIQLRNTAGGLLARFKVGRGPDGDRALEAAEDGVFDGLSVGTDFDLSSDAIPDPQQRGALLVRRADLRHVALTDEPVFDNARVTKVAASRSDGGGPVADTDSDTTAEPVEAPDTEPEPSGLSLSQDQLTALLSRPGAIQALVQTQQPAAEQADEPAGGLALSADQVDALIRSGGLATLLGLPGMPAGPDGGDGEDRPAKVDPTRSVGLSRINEATPYRFDKDGNLRPGSHDFSNDLIFAGRDHDEAAYRRALSFIQAQFDTDTADVAALNPNIQRPDLYVDQLDFVYPIWQSINRGMIGSVTPFVIPKFASSSALVGDHTQGVEPTAGTFVATSQTITPTPVSGKAEITRETWDQGGNPQVSALIWRQMQREWAEDLEAAAATFLNTLTAAVDINLGVAVVDDALISAWDAEMAGLQFARGGHRFRMFAVHIDLYLAFVDASDSTGRKLIPIINPQNASGTATPRFGVLDLSGVMGVPSWALGTSGTTPQNSWLFNPEDVHGWASAPQRLQFDHRVSHVEIGIWGYKALANTRIDGVRQVIYDPSTAA